MTIYVVTSIIGIPWYHASTREKAEQAIDNLTLIFRPQPVFHRGRYYPYFSIIEWDLDLPIPDEFISPEVLTRQPSSR